MSWSFLPRDAMHSTDYAVARCVSVRLSVCPSVARRYSTETAKDIITLCYHQVATLHWYFRTKQTAW